VRSQNGTPDEVVLVLDELPAGTSSLRRQGRLDRSASHCGEHRMRLSLNDQTLYTLVCIDELLMFSNVN